MNLDKAHTESSVFTKKRKMHPSAYRRLSMLLVLLFILLSISYGQQPNQNESDVIAKAESLFKDKNYQEALPLYAQLVSVHPENPEYNYKFGVCTFHGDRSDRRRPIRYLINASKSMAGDATLQYYLGMAYYQNEEFAEAMKHLNLYLAKLDANASERPVILERVNACLNGLNLEHKNLIGEIMAKSEFQKDNFHRAYRADEFDGMLILKPEAFVTAQEKNSGTNSFVFISEPRGTLYYSGYGDGNSTQRDIFKVKMLENGDWDKPEKISDEVNTNFDEAYPIMTANGTILYFCSKGHNSMGGYDIFRTTLDTATNKFSPPENLGIGINSPFDDILFIPDKTGKFAYYASDRDNLNGAINVYKIRLIENAFGQDLLLAEKGIEQDLSEITNRQEEKKISGNIKPELNNSSKDIADNSETELAPSEKAENLMNKRTMVHQLADTAYLLVAETKNLIRNLTNKRDRANAVSESKSEMAKNLEVDFEKIISGLPEIKSDDEFDKALQKAINLKKEIFQYRSRADHANLIAWKIGKQIKIKNDELNDLKKRAGEVQTLSLSNDYDKTFQQYNQLVDDYHVADSLTDFSIHLLQLNSNEISYEVPQTELVFANELRTGYKNNTLLANSQLSKGKPVPKDVPIVVVDNRQHAQQPAKPSVEIVPQVDPVNNISELVLNIEEDLEVGFGIDAVEPVKLAERIDWSVPDEIAAIDETELDIDLMFDAVEPADLVTQVGYQAAIVFSDLDNEEIEISFESDAIEPVSLIEQVEFAAKVDFEEIDNIIPEVNFIVDAIEPATQIEKIAYHPSEINFPFENTELELDSKIDAVEPTQLVEPIAYNPQVIDAEISENELEINIAMDAVEPAGQTEEIAYVPKEITLAFAENEIEINNAVDSAVPASLTNLITYSSDGDVVEVDEPELEINFTIDAVSPVQQVMEIVYENRPVEIDFTEELNFDESYNAIASVALVEPVYPEPAEIEFAMDEQIETGNLNTSAEPVKLVKQVEFNAPELMAVEESEIDIAFVNDANKPETVIAPIDYNNSYDLVMDDEIEVTIEKDVEIAEIVEPVEFDAASYADIVADEEIETGIPAVEKEIVNPAKQVEKVLFVAMLQDVAIEENLEISKDQINAIPLVAPVYPEDLALKGIDIEDENIEIGLRNNRIRSTGIIRLTEPVYHENLTIAPIPAEEIEVGFKIDEIEPKAVATVIEPDWNNLIDINAAQENLTIYFGPDELEHAEQPAQESITEMPAIGTDLFYLQESMSVAGDIETSRTDYEMLKLAIVSPGDLSYEELLYSASLASNPEDKLNIYNQAFIHLDRDWRAFNNAGVTAIHIKDFEKAECYLYQASLISEDNGKIQNNMGILSCYLKDYSKAEQYFVTAGKLGVDSEYNLEVVRNMSNSHNNMSDKLREQIGEHRYYEVLGDASTPGANK